MRDPWSEPTAMPDSDLSGPAVRWGVTVGAVALFFLLSVVAAPGQDVTVLPYQSFPVVGSAGVLAILVGVRGFAAISRAEGRILGWQSAVIYVFVVAAFARTTAVQLELVYVGNSALVPDPGFLFRWVFAVSVVGGAAICWVLADWISRSGAGSGPLVLAGFGFGLHALGDVLDQGSAIGLRSGLDPLSVLPLVVTVALAGLLTRRSPDFPWSARDWLRFRSWLDVIAVPVVAHGMVAFASSYVDLPSALADGASVIAGGVVAARGWADGTPRLARGPAVLGLLAALTFATAGGLGWLGSGALERLGQPSPYAGTQSGTVVISTVEAGPRDVQILMRRIELLGLDATVEPRGENLVIEVRGVSDPSVALVDLLSPHHWSIHGVDEKLTHAHEKGPLAELPDHRSLVESCWRDTCVPLVIGEAFVDNGDVAQARVAWDTQAEPYVWVDFTPRGGRALADHTASSVGKRLAVVQDGRVTSAPVVLEPISGGALRIASDPESPERDAVRLVAALTTGPYEGVWKVVRGL